MALWRKALDKTKNLFKGSLDKVLLTKGPVDDELLEELESELLRADIAPRLTADIIKALSKRRGEDADELRQHLKNLLVEALGSHRAWNWQELAPQSCILVVGVNGSGKTTSTAKLGVLAAQQGLRPLLGAGDTFRAAGTDQLRLWADRTALPIVAGQLGSDAASVAFDALEALHARQLDVLLLDTAGRMHTKQPLMEELRKTVRAMQKRDPQAPQETWMVLDASIGQNAISQARFFHEATPLTGLVITKLDGSAKAGFLFSVKKELDVPVYYTGIGEQAEDLVPFEPEAFVHSLLDIEEPVVS